LNVSRKPADIETSAFAGLPCEIGRGGGVIATEREGRAVARVAARRGRRSRAAQVLRENLGIEPPDAPLRVSQGDIALAAIAPGTWLALREGAGNDFAQSLRPLLRDCASIADLTDAYAMLRLTGPDVRATLAKLVPIDIHTRAFGVNAVAQTLCGHMSVILWRLEDSATWGPTFEIWVGRSLAVSLHEALGQSAAEFGFLRQPARAPVHEERPRR
jgi:heterotetrameric sarcosine oxidase gamma subunit